MRELIDGSTAIVRGALAAGCDFFAGYPITPASGILMDMMREVPARGGMAIQGEDEISSLGMCIGAAMAGARAMTATSGPGLSLMSENIGLAVMGEVPLVIVDVQRLGPATGGATTVAQGDVQFIRWGTAGGFPVIALAPSSIRTSFTLTLRAFELARRLRCPVFLLSDKELALTLGTVEGGLSAPTAASPSTGPGEDGGVGEGTDPALPYSYDPPAGVPPWRSYGGGNGAAGLRFTGSTHDERAFITKHPPTVEALNRHLIAKIEERRGELEDVEADLDPTARVLAISYGVTAGALRQAVAVHRKTGGRVSALVVHSLWPLPELALARAFKGVEKIVVAELNPGLLRREIERLAGGRKVVGLHRLDGELISPDQFLEALP